MNRFEPETHKYFIDGKEVPSVTQVLVEAGLIDLSFYNEEGKKRGSAVHQACQYLDEDDLDVESISPGLRPYVEAYINFKKETDFKPELIEHQVYETFYGFAGTVDRTGIMRGKRVLIDIKTGSIAPFAAIQTAGYTACLHNDFYHRFGLCLKPNGAFKLLEFNDSNDESIFLSALAVAKWKRRFL